MTISSSPLTTILVGPTGTGKTAVSLRLAARLGAEIVCADSRQLYRRFDAGTGKPTARERAQVAHHLFDWLEPEEWASAGRYARAAADAVRSIHARGARALLVGGTGLYVRALTHGLAPIPPVPDEIRDAVRDEATARGPIALYDELTHSDPPTAERLAPRDVQRIARALEVQRATGRPLSWWIRQPPPEPAPLGGAPVIGLTRERATLYELLDARTSFFFTVGGLVQEVRGLLEAGVSPDSPAFRSIGYAEALALARGECTLDAAISAARQATRRYAKRQWTWWRQEAERVRFTWIECGGLEADEIAGRALAAAVALGGAP